MNRLVYLGVAVAAVAGCNGKKSNSTQTSVTQKVGAAGGTVKLGESLTLEIPAGALTGEQTIAATVGSSTVPGYDVDTPHYTLTPEGLTFAIPIKIKLERTTAKDGQHVFWSKADGAAGYDSLETTIVEAGGKSYLQASNTHFSDVFGGRSTESGPTGPTGSSGPTCEQTQCGDACVDLQTSAAHCGACETACGDGQACMAGVCKTHVTLTVDTGLVGEVGEDTFEVAFVALKGPTAWVPLTTLTASESERVKEYAFDTTASTYEVIVGCTDNDEADDGHSDDRKVTHFKKTTATRHLAVACNPLMSPPPTYRNASITFSHGSVGDDIRIGTIFGSNDGFADAEGGGVVDLESVPDGAFDLFACQYPAAAEPVCKIFRGLDATATNDHIDLSIDLTGAVGTTGIQVITHFAASDGDINLISSALSPYAAQGTFSFLLDNQGADGPFNHDVPFTQAYRFFGTSIMTAAEGHLLHASFSRSTSGSFDLTWELNATVPSALQAATVTADHSLVIDLPPGMDLSGALTAIDTRILPRVEAIPHGSEKGVQLYANASVTDLWRLGWTMIVDGGVVSGATHTLAIEDLADFDGADASFTFDASSTVYMTVTVHHESAESVDHPATQTDVIASGSVAAD